MLLPAKTLPAAAVALLALGCLNTTPPGAVLSSSPRGARVLVDGRDSGFVTPCQIRLDTGEHQRIRLELAGYEPAELVLRENPGIDTSDWTYGIPIFPGWYEYSVVPWSDGYIAYAGVRVPLFLEMRDALLPIRFDFSHHPSRVHLRLDPIEEE